MNDPMVYAAAIVLVIAAFGSMIVQIVNARSAAEERRDAKAARIRLEDLAHIADVKNNRIIEQGVAIHTLTNSNLSTVTAALATAMAKNETLERIITTQSEAKKVADTLASSTTITNTNPIKTENEVFHEIKENTADTAQAVKDLNLKKGK